METHWKQSIISFLNEGNEDELKKRLRKDWIDVYPEDKMEVYRFLFLAKRYSLFFSLFALDLQSRAADLPWVQLLLILHNEKVEIPKELFKELVVRFRKHKLISKKPKSLGELITELRAKQRYQFLQNALKAKQELIASAQIAQSEQLLDQHVHYMNELKKMAPREYNVSHLISEREKRNAEKILSRRANRAPAQTQQEESLSHEDLDFISRLGEQALQYLSQKKATPSDFAYLFRTLGEHKMAIEFIYQSDDNAAKDWQLLDYLLTGKQYLSLLNHCLDLKQKYSGNPDSLFAISYAEAVAYWELGEKEKALDLMGQISAMRPDFKSATETLAQWKEESFD